MPYECARQSVAVRQASPLMAKVERAMLRQPALVSTALAPSAIAMQKLGLTQSTCTSMSSGSGARPRLTHRLPFHCTARPPGATARQNVVVGQSPAADEPRSTGREW